MEMFYNILEKDSNDIVFSLYCKHNACSQERIKERNPGYLLVLSTYRYQKSRVTALFLLMPDVTAQLGQGKQPISRYEKHWFLIKYHAVLGVVGLKS